MKLIIIRHAQSIGNLEGRWQGHKEFSLSEKGIQQAKKLHNSFVTNNFCPDYIYSSPLSRTLLTAEISFPDNRIIKIPDLIERDIGVFSGKTSSEIKEQFPELAEQFSKHQDLSLIPETENQYDLRKRANNVINFLIKGHNQSDNIVVFSHGGIMRYLIAVILGTNRIWKVKISNTSIFEFEIDSDNWIGSNNFSNNFEIIRFSDLKHLDV